MTAPVRFAILGFGHHAVRRLLPAFAASKCAVLTGMWRRDGEAAARDCAQHGIPRCFATREELCASADVDVVFITSPDAMHKDDTLFALRHGKAVLCEKPLAMNAAEADVMAAAAKAAGLLFGVAQNFRWNQTLDWMREQIAAGRIGVPQLAHAQYAYSAANAPRKWIKDIRLAAGGPIADVGVHCIDSLRYVLGQDVVSVSTVAREGEKGSGVEAHAALQLEMTNGIFAAVTVSAAAPYRTLVEVTGSEGVIVGENGLSVERAVDVVLWRGSEVVEAKSFTNHDGYARMIDSFAAAFRGEGTFIASADDGSHNMRVLDAAYRSWRTGQREAV